MWLISWLHIALGRARHSDAASQAGRDNAKAVNSQSVTVDGVKYESKTAAANSLGISIQTFIWRLNSKTEKFANYTLG